MPDSYGYPSETWKRAWICVAFAAAAVFFSIAPHHNNVLGRIDLRAAEALNGWIGVSSAYDRALALLNHATYDKIAGALILFVIYLVYAWRQRYTEGGRVLGFLLVVGGTVLLALGISYWLTHSLEKELNILGPKFALKSFRDLGHFFKDWKIDVSDRASVPSRRATLYFTVFWMAFYRSRGLAAALALPALLFSFAGVAVGREWPSSAVASVLWAGAVASLLTRTPLVEFPRWVEDASFDAVERFMTFWTPNRPRFGKDWQAPQKDSAPHTTPEVLSPEGRAGGDRTMETLIRRHIVPLLCHGVRGSLSISRPEGSLQDPPHGPYARLLGGEGLDRTLVVRGAWRLLGPSVGSRRLERARNAADAHTLAQLRGAPVPPLLSRREGIAGFPPLRFHLTAETLAPGKPLTVGSPEDCAKAAKALAALHAIERADAGGVGLGAIPRARYPHRAVLPRVLQWIVAIEREAPAAEIAFFGERTPKWFWRRAVEIVDSGALFRFVLGGLAPQNVAISDAGASLSDFTSARFDLAGMDVLDACIEWTGGEQAAARVLFETYFAAAGEARWEDFRASLDFCVAFIAMRRAVRLLLAPDAPGPLDPHRLATVAARALQGAIDAPGSPQQAAEALCALFFGRKPL